MSAAAQQAVPAEQDDPPREQAQTRPSTASVAQRDIYRVLGALWIVTGALHAKAMVDHAAHYWLFGVCFGLLMCWQTVWGVRAYRLALGRRALLAGAWVNAAVVVIWLISRTVGMPIGPWAGRSEAIGVIDTMVSLDELVIVALVASLVSASDHPWLAWLRSGYAVRLGVMLASASLFVVSIGGHTH